MTFLTVVFAAIAAGAGALTVWLTLKNRDEERQYRVEERAYRTAQRESRENERQEQLRVRRLAQLERIQELVIRFREVAQETRGQEWSGVRLQLVREQLDVAVNIYLALDGQPLPECQEQGHPMRVNPATPMSPSEADTFSIARACLAEIRSALDVEVSARY